MLEHLPASFGWIPNGDMNLNWSWCISVNGSLFWCSEHVWPHCICFIVFARLRVHVCAVSVLIVSSQGAGQATWRQCLRDVLRADKLLRLSLRVIEQHVRMCDLVWEGFEATRRSSTYTGAVWRERNVIGIFTTGLSTPVPWESIWGGCVNTCLLVEGCSR